MASAPSESPAGRAGERRDPSERRPRGPRRGRRGRTTDSRARDALELLLRLPVAEREGAARRRHARDPGVLAEVLRLLPHAEPPTEFLAHPELGFATPPEPPRPDSHPGRVLNGRWRLAREVGRGGQGVVCEADDLVAGGRAAVKLIRGVGAAGAARIRREAATLRWLRLPGVVRLLDDGEDRGDVWLAMEFLEGVPFPGPPGGAAPPGKFAPPAPRTWAEIETASLGLLEALGRVHAAGVVHGDLKPQNVLVDARGVVTILDLGLAAARSDRFVDPRPTSGGTPGYVAPERMEGHPPHVRSDLYAVGVLLVEAMTGRRPEPHEHPGLPAPTRVRRAVARLLAREPADRWASAGEALRALRPARGARRRRRAWTEAELRSRFGGFDRFHHLREDAARELFARTGGDAAAVEEELASWIRAGLAAVEGDLVHVSRVSLDRMHRLPPADPSRAVGRRAARPTRADAALDRALRSGDARDVARSALRAAQAALDLGHASKALSALEEGAAAARAAGGRRVLRETLRLAVTAALSTASGREVDRALWLVQRCGDGDRALAALADVARAAGANQRGDWRQAWKLATRVCRSGPRVARHLAWSVRALAAQSLGLAHQRRVVAESAEWARGERRREARTAKRTWEAYLLYREGHCDAAMRLHLANVKTARSRPARMRSLLDAADAALDAGHATTALALSQSALRIAAGLRRSSQEVRAHAGARDALRRCGVSLVEDPESLRAIDALGFRALAANARMVEAVIAWRRGAPMEARRILAPLCVASPPGELSTDGLAARCLDAAAGGPLSPDTARALALRAARIAAPTWGAQILGLLASGVRSERDWLRSRFRTLRLPRLHPEWTRPREFLSLAESAEAVGLGSTGNPDFRGGERARSS